MINEEPISNAAVIIASTISFTIRETTTFILSISYGAVATVICLIIAYPFAYALAPIVGVVAWQLAAAAITGFIAKENVVGTLAVCFVGLDNLIGTEELSMLEGSAAEVAGILAISKAAALAYLMFNLFSPPCFAAIGAMNAELKSKKWLFAGIGLQLGVGYSIGFITYFFGTLISGEGFVHAWMPILGWAILISFAVILTILIAKRDKEIAKIAKANSSKEAVKS